jgi:hypothetical protein
MTAALLLALLLGLLGLLGLQVQLVLVQPQLVWLLAWQRCQMMAAGLWSQLQALLGPTACLLQP